MTRIQGVPDLGPGLRLHLNENTGGCSAKVVEAVRAFDGPGLATYPDYRAAVTETAAFLGVDPEWVVLTNGLDEGVLLAAIAFLAPAEQPPEVVMAMPAFEPYVTTARAMHARLVTVPPGRDYAFPLDAVLGAVTAQTKLIYINNPNNPSGQPVSKEAIRRVATTAAHAVVFVDEAYHDFMGENFLDEAASYPNVLIGRTFSKAYGLAGMRVGVMIARPQVLEPIRFAMPLFNLNVVAVQALRAALTDTEFRPWYVAQAEESKRRLYAALEKVGLRYWKSAANFVLVDGGEGAREIVDGMIARGVLVRDRTKDPYCPNCFRITTGVVEHTPSIQASWSVTNALVQPFLGRNYNGGVASRTAQLIREGLEYGDDNLHQLDLKLSKRFDIDRYRVRLDFDVYNVFNSSWPFTVNSNYSTAPTSQWLRPTNVLTQRFFKLGGQFSF